MQTCTPQQRANARSYLNVYIRRGKVVRQPCQECGEPISEAHHDDYSKSLEVQWFCRKHHLELKHPAHARGPIAGPRSSYSPRCPIPKTRPPAPEFKQCCGQNRACVDSRNGHGLTRRRYCCLVCKSRETTYEFTREYFDSLLERASNPEPSPVMKNIDVEEMADAVGKLRKLTDHLREHKPR